MGMTMIENLLAGKAGLTEVHAGDIVTVEVDMCVMIDLQFATLWVQPSRIHDPAKVAVIMDHAVPAPTLKDAEGGPKARRFVADFGIQKFYDVGTSAWKTVTLSTQCKPGSDVGYLDGFQGNLHLTAKHSDGLQMVHCTFVRASGQWAEQVH